MSNTQKLIDQFYTAASYKKLEDLRNAIQTPNYPIEVRKKIYEESKELIENLKSIFVNLVIERNNLAKENGFDNYFDFVSDWYGIPSEQRLEYKKLYPLISKRIFNDVPEYLNQPKDYWTEFNNPIAFSLIADENKYPLPQVVYNHFHKQFNNFNNLKDRIQLVETKDRYFYTDFNLEDKSVVINGNINAENSGTAISFAQEVGHAITMLTLMDNDVNPDKMPDHWHELHAIEYEIDFENTLPSNLVHVLRDRILYHNVLSLFEEKIYTTCDVDFDQVYAQVHNEIYPLSSQTMNPFYVLNYFIIDLPCYSAVYSTVYTQLLKSYYLD